MILGQFSEGEDDSRTDDNGNAHDADGVVHQAGEHPGEKNEQGRQEGGQAGDGSEGGVLDGGDDLDEADDGAGDESDQQERQGDVVEDAAAV